MVKMKITSEGDDVRAIMDICISKSILMRNFLALMVLIQRGMLNMMDV